MFFLIEAQVKNKWKSLCTTFQKEMSKVPKLPSGSAAITFSSKWVNFESLKFMSNKVNRNTVGGINDFSMKGDDVENIVIDGSASETCTPQKSIPKTTAIRKTASTNLRKCISMMPYVRSIKNPQLKLREEADEMLYHFIFSYSMHNIFKIYFVGRSKLFRC